MKIIALVDGSVSTYARLSPVLGALLSRGHEVFVDQQVEVRALEGHDVVILQRPIYDSKQILLGRSLYGYKVVVDLDDEFSLIPPKHPGYKSVGPGNPEAIANLELALQEADGVILSTEALRKSRGFENNDRCTVFPITWEDTYDFWDLKKFSRDRGAKDMLQIGWAGTITHREDFNLVDGSLEWIARQYPNVRIVVGGDLEIYHKLAKVKESQKLFIPALPYQVYPWMLSQFDILLAPLRDTPFNRCKSDIKLVEAGIAGIPWVASPVGAYRDTLMLAGGEFAGNWQQIIAHLVESPYYRKQLGEQGREAVMERTAVKQVEKLESFLQGVINA